MDLEQLFGRYRLLQSYVGWTDLDEGRIRRVATLLGPHLASLIEDFYAEIHRHPEVRSVITGGEEQVGRLKGSLLGWLRDLLSGRYDEEYVGRRWRVGLRHVEIGLDQAYTHAALSRLRVGLIRVLGDEWSGDGPGLAEASLSMTKLLDLDLAIIQDAYRAAESTRLQRAERLATMGQVAEAAECLIVVIRPDRSILYFNPFARRVAGYADDEVLGKSGDAPTLRGSVRELVDRVLAGEPVFGHEQSVASLDGSRRWIVWNARRLDDFEGGPAVLAVGQDITALKRAQDRALQSERLAAIGQMVAGLAHESRNALQRVHACLEMLALADEGRPRSLDLIARIEQAQHDLHRLFEDVRGYAAPIRLERRSTDLAEVCRAAWADLDSQHRGRDVDFQPRFEGVDTSFDGDPFRLGQVFRNLLDNALAACGDPVEISVTAEAARIEGCPGLRVVVRDNGPGLDAQQSAKLFEPFFTTKTKGTGLGLAISRRIVEAHGGRIEAGAGEGPGTEIILTIPREET